MPIRKALSGFQVAYVGLTRGIVRAADHRAREVAHRTRAYARRCQSQGLIPGATQSPSTVRCATPTPQKKQITKFSALSNLVVRNLGMYILNSRPVHPDCCSRSSPALCSAIHTAGPFWSTPDFHTLMQESCRLSSHPTLIPWPTYSLLLCKVYFTSKSEQA